MVGKYTTEKTTRILRAAMALEKVTGAEIGRNLKINRSSVNGVINGQSKSRRVRRALAERFNFKVTDLWPEEML
jgi:hypothetical protein